MTAMNRVGVVVPETIASLGLQKKYYAQCAILYWRTIVGEEIASHSRAQRLERGVLTVTVSNSVWTHHLFLLKQELIGKINTYIGQNVITDIRFLAGNRHKETNEENTEANEPAPLYAKLRAIRLEKAEVMEARKMVEEVADPVLQKKLLTMLYKNTALKKVRQKEGWHECHDCGVLCPPAERYCAACLIEQKKESLSAVRKMLRQAPWQNYHDFNQSLPCSFSDYLTAKQYLMNNLIQDIRMGQADENDEAALAMLTTGLSPFELTDDMIKNQIAKFRRKSHVSTSRSR